jgi:hypothetical protein
MRMKREMMRGGRMNPGIGGSAEEAMEPTGPMGNRAPMKKGSLKDRINAVAERVNAGRQAKLSAKADVAAAQGNMSKAARLEMRSKKVALRSEKRQAIGNAKTAKKVGKALGKAASKMSDYESTPVMKNTLIRSTKPVVSPINRPQTGELKFK